MKVAVMTDSTAYIPAHIRKEWDIHMVPLSVIFGDASYQEEVDITAEEFYAKVKNEPELPKTSQPSIGYISEKLEELSKDYDAVISIHLSSGISGTYQAIATAGEMTENIDVYAYDSEISCGAQAFYVFEAANMAKENKNPKEIIKRLDEIKRSIQAYFMVDDLTNLQRGGRLSSAQALVGSLLQVKPILHFVDRVIVPFEKIRTKKKALNRITGLLEEDIAKGKKLEITIIHANAREDAEQFRDEILKKHPSLTITISYFGPVIGTHLGEGALGMCWYEH